MSALPMTMVCPEAQARLLCRLRGTGMTIASLQAACADHGATFGASTVGDWFTGKRCAAMGVLWVLFEHCGAPEVLGLLARDHGLRVVQDTGAAAPQPSSPPAEVLFSLVEALGRFGAFCRGPLTEEQEEHALDEIQTLRLGLNRLESSIRDARRPE